MKKQNSIRRTILIPLCVLIGVVGATAWAGGPLQIIRQGVALRWDPAQPVRIVFDNGPLSEFLTRDQGAAAVREILQVWEDVPTASITFSDEGFLAVDVNASNVNTFLNNPTPRATRSFSMPTARLSNRLSAMEPAIQSWVLPTHSLRTFKTTSLTAVLPS